MPAVFLAVTNTIIFIYVHRSSRRVHQTNSENIRKSARANQRNNRLLKHMLFIFIAFFIGWVPIYIIGVVNWNGVGISYVAYHALQMLPTICFIINIVDLFWYNHELRTYFRRKISHNRI